MHAVLVVIQNQCSFHWLKDGSDGFSSRKLRLVAIYDNDFSLMIFIDFIDLG